MTGDTLHADLADEERLLQGALSHGVSGAPDPVEARIRWLVTSRLRPVGQADDGWAWLFRDPRDGRLWEQTFPLGSLHGGGPRRLAVVDRAYAREKYGLAEMP